MAFRQIKPEFVDEWIPCLIWRCLSRELRKRVDDLEAAAVGADQVAAAEARARQAQANLARKDVLLKEMRERLEAVQQSALQASAEAAAAQGGGSGEAVEKLERAVTRLRSELGRKDLALRAAQADLDKVCVACITHDICYAHRPAKLSGGSKPDEQRMRLPVAGPGKAPSCTTSSTPPATPEGDAPSPICPAAHTVHSRTPHAHHSHLPHRSHHNNLMTVGRPRAHAPSPPCLHPPSLLPPSSPPRSVQRRLRQRVRRGTRPNARPAPGATGPLRARRCRGGRLTCCLLCVS